MFFQIRFVIAVYLTILLCTLCRHC